MAATLEPLVHLSLYYYLSGCLPLSLPQLTHYRVLIYLNLACIKNTTKSNTSGELKAGSYFLFWWWSGGGGLGVITPRILNRVWGVRSSII